MRIALLCVDCEDCKLPQETLNNYPGRIEVEQIGSHDVKDGALCNFDTLILPGGASRKYSKALGKVGAWQIQSFVESGGNYLGICAGAYYACKRIQWRISHPDSIDEKDTLGFVDATARGPIRQFADNEEPLKGKIVHLDFYDRCVSSLYLGGPRFIIHPREKKNVQVLATYCEMQKKHHAAIIQKKVGLGMVTLVSTHPEISNEQIRNLTPRRNGEGPLKEAIVRLKKDNRFSTLNTQVFYDLIMQMSSNTLTELC